MGTIRCARCGANEDESSASFAEEGLICANCHAGVIAGDAAQQRTQVNEAAAFGKGVRMPSIPTDISFSSGSSTSRSSASGPLVGAAATLASLGLSAQRSAVSKTVTTPLGTNAADGYHERWTLSAAPSVQASFGSESFMKTIVKLFKRELQTGDAAFDDTVYIESSTNDATLALLQREDVRATIADIVSRGGYVSIQGNVIEGESLWSEAESNRPQDQVARVVLAIVEGR